MHFIVNFRIYVGLTHSNGPNSVAMQARWYNLTNNYISYLCLGRVEDFSGTTNIYL